MGGVYQIYEVPHRWLHPASPTMVAIWAVVNCCGQLFHQPEDRGVPVTRPLHPSLLVLSSSVAGPQSA